MQGSEIKRERQAVARIVALLLALAALAERASNAPAAIRLFVVWLLRIGEVRAHNLAVSMAIESGYTAGFVGQHDDRQGHGPVDALRLASWFRALAAVVQLLSQRLYPANSGHSAGHAAHIPHGGVLAALLAAFRATIHTMRLLAAAPACLPAAPDTS